MRTLISLFAICIPLLFSSQVVQIYSIDDIRQAGGDNGYTLNGAKMADSRAKLLDYNNFGPSGIYPKPVSITDGFASSGSLADVASLPTESIFFFGSFDIYNVYETFTPEEIDALYNWSVSGGKMIICAGQAQEGLQYDSRILNQKWGFSFLQSGASCYPTPQGNANGPFNGPFGHVDLVNEGGPLRGYIDSLPASVQVLAEATPNGLGPTIYMDCATLDLIVADPDVFTNYGGISQGSTMQNAQDKFWGNVIAFMDKLQKTPVLQANDDTLRAGDNYLHYQWYKDDKPITGANANTYTMTEFGTYHVETTVNGGCIVRSDDFVKPDTALVLENECDLFVPTAFSPDGNGINETLCMYGRCFKDIEFKIFDRLGEMVFESKERWSCWDGNYKGMKANSGTYVWSCKATRPSGTTINRKGYTTLIRK